MTDSIRAQSWSRNLVILQVVIVVLILLVGKPHTMLHGMEWPVPTPEQVAKFDFIGVQNGSSPSIWSILLETASWSFVGVMARAEYRLARTIQERRQVGLATAVAQILGDAAAGISIAVALVALFWSSEIKIVDVQVTLRRSGVGSVIAVSFVLGFFHDRTQRLVGLVHERLFGRSETEMPSTQGLKQRADTTGDSNESS